MSITSGLAPRRYANGGMSEEEQFKEAMRSQVIAKIEERLGIEIPRGSKEAEDALINSILGGATDLPISKRGDEITYGDNDGFSFYVNPEEEGAGVRYNKRFAQGGLAAYANGGGVEDNLDPYRLKEIGQGFKDYIFDYTDPYDYATLPLYAAGPLGAVANKSIKAARIANKIKKGKKGGKRQDVKVDEYKPSGIENILGSKSLAYGVPAATLTGEIAYELATEEEELEDDALDQATEDLDVVNANEDAEEKEKTLLERLSGLSELGGMPDTPTMSQGYMIEGSGISTPEIRRYEGGGIANMMPIGMAEGGSFDFSKLSSLGGMPDTPTMTPGSAIASANINTPEIKKGDPEALRDVKKDFDEFETDVESNYVNFAGGGIANMDPMMMAGGGIAKFAVGKEVVKKTAKAAIKKGKKGIEKLKKYKDGKAKAKAKAKADKDKAAKAKAKADAKETGVTKDKPKDPGFLDFVPGAYATGITATARKAGELASAAKRNVKPIAGAALAYGLPAAGVIGGAKALFGKDETLKPPTKSTDATVPEIEESNAMKDILYQNSLERATSAGRTEPTFIDYLASFPGSYTEKVGKDPEFARQMMAGFMAMMKPTEGYVPRNALVDFGEAAMAEEVRQEGEIPDQIKLMERFKDDPELLDAYKKFVKSQEAYDPMQEQKARAQIFSNLQEMIFGPGFEEDDIPINISTKQPAEPFTVYNEFLSLGGDQAALFALKDKYSME